ncbi:hypothetical protein DEJ23_11255 [Curtobacterium sp. MCSS17_008]|uniref:hypothetical protein n=1 Tax=Curtobacterium sp. MCSS17_008 TaxID=2175647 RepID=UPI000DA89B12|nr:hypothetical protein [Curtobacterium sp. MCSS17_008]PZF56129.1 hypothetical protein DEJ23_11255 [Curtobacterium sp. MCSS17_008]
MLWGRRRTLTAAITATTLTAVLLLTGCSAQVDAGSAGAVEAERELSGIDGVRSVRGSGTNNLPFAGTVSVVVTADDDLSDAQLLRVTHEVGRWIADASGQGTTYSGSMEADGFDFPVRRHASENEELLSVVDRFRGDDRWLGGRVSAPEPSGTGGGRIALAVRHPGDLVRGWEAVRKTMASSGWETATASASWWQTPPEERLPSDDAELQITDHVPGSDDTVGDPSVEIAAYERVTAAHEVTRASVAPGRIHLHLTDLDDVRDATALARQAAPDAQVIVDGGIVTKDVPQGDDDLPDAADYDEADRLAAVAVRPGVTAVSVTPTGLRVTVDDPDEVLATATALAAAAPADPVTSIRVGPQEAADGAGDAADQDIASNADRLSVSGSPEMLDASIQVGTQLRGFPPASSEQFDTNESVAATLSDVEQVPAFVEALRPVLPDGTGLHVRLAGRGTGGTTQLTLRNGVLTAEPLRNGEERGTDRTDLERALQDAWNR